MEVTAITESEAASEEADLVTPDHFFSIRSVERPTFALKTLTALPTRCLLLALLGLPFSAVALADDTGATTEGSSSQPEEMTITGERPLFQLREELWSAEQDAYELFNQFNDERRFEISCRMHQSTGTRFETQVCQPRFEQEATSEHGQAFLESYRHFLGPLINEGVPLTDGSSSSSMSVEFRIASQQRQYRQKMRKVAEEHPEFLNAIMRYTEIRSRYEEVSRPGNAD